MNDETADWQDEERLRRAATHVAYELRMLCDAFANRSDRFAYTAWFIHCRTLMDFFDSDGQQDDICAHHFFEDAGEWRSLRDAVTKPGDYDEFRMAVHKLAAHLTFARLEYAGQDKFAPARHITAHLVGMGMLFLRALPADRMPWFGEAFLPAANS